MPSSSHCNGLAAKVELENFRTDLFFILERINFQISGTFIYLYTDAAIHVQKSASTLADVLYSLLSQFCL